jgi:hypothetical protein
VAWLDELDNRAGVKPPSSSVDETAHASRSGRGRWRKRPVFYWRHKWSRLDVLAAGLVIAGLFDVVNSQSGPDHLRTLRGLGVLVFGGALFAVLSLFPDDRE